MFDDKSTLINELGSPLNVSSMALDELESRLNGEKVIADPNSAFCFLLEFGSSVAAACSNKIDQTLPLLYPKRATSADDLYRHMSDYDYLRMYANPATTTLVLAFPKKYLSDNALQFNSNYKKVTIPKDTVFMIGKYPFGLHYSIDILINVNTNTFTVAYDTTSGDNLITLTKNIVDKYDVVRDSLEYLVIEFPIYQFSKSVIEESIIPETGFAKRYLYNNYFYAVRVFAYKEGTYTELNLTQSESVYDVTTPTVLMRVLPDEQKLKLTIPQIYLDQADIGSKAYIELYTTLGALNINTDNINANSISINFSKRTKDTTDYSALLASLPFDTIVTIKSGANISGGSNPISLDTLRDRVINNTLYDSVPITANQIEVYLNDNGFTAKKYQDNVTSRIWEAYRILEDGDGKVIPSRTCQLKMDDTYPSTCSTFRLESDGSITILPTAIYSYSELTDVVTPLNDETMNRIGEMDKSQLASELNNNVYFKSPFHTRITLDEYYPRTVSYNLMTPSIERTVFVTENYYVPAKMVAYDGLITHLNNGTGGYRLRISVYESDEIKNLDKSDLLVYVIVKTDNGLWIGGEASYLTSTSERDVFEIKISTNYKLTDDDEFAVTNLKNPNIELQEYNVSLQSDVYVVFLMKASAVVGTYQAATAELTEGVPASYLENYVGISRQYFNIKFGYSLADVLNHEMEVSLTAETYAKWDHNVPATYEEDVYERDSSGKLVYVIDDEGELKLNKIHSAGEEKKDELGLPIYLHKQGEVRYGADGKPLVESNRSKVYYVEMLLIDAKLFASERSAELTFVDQMYSTLEGYFSTIRTLQSQMLELTYVYFKCIKSVGTAKYNLGDNVTTTGDIELSFKINAYVPSYVKTSESIQTTIKDQLCELINAQIKTRVINMQEIFDTVKSQMSDYIDYFDLLGINGNTDLQTFQIVDSEVQPSLKRKLVLTDDNILSLENDLEVDFIALEDNTSTTSVSTS